MKLITLKYFDASDSQILTCLKAYYSKFYSTRIAFNSCFTTCTICIPCLYEDYGQCNNDADIHSDDCLHSRLSYLLHFCIFTQIVSLSAQFKMVFQKFIKRMVFIMKIKDLIKQSYEDLKT